MNDTKQGETELRSLPADLGAGDPEASAGAIPNLIAGLVETETWRNAATVLMGALLIGLGYWAYTGVRTALADTRVASLQALLGTVVKGLDVWIDEHMSEVQRVARDPDVVARAARLAAERRDPAAAVGRCTQEAEELSARVLSSTLDQRCGGVPYRRPWRPRARLEGSAALRPADAPGTIPRTTRPCLRR